MIRYHSPNEFMCGKEERTKFQNPKKMSYSRAMRMVCVRFLPFPYFGDKNRFLTYFIKQN